MSIGNEIQVVIGGNRVGQVMRHAKKDTDLRDGVGDDFESNLVLFNKYANKFGQAARKIRDFKKRKYSFQIFINPDGDKPVILCISSDQYHGWGVGLNYC